MAISSPHPRPSSFSIPSETNALFQTSLRPPYYCCSVSAGCFPLGRSVDENMLCRVNKLFNQAAGGPRRRGTCSSRMLFTAFAKLSPHGLANGLTGRSRRFCSLVPGVKKKGNYTRKRTWWQKFFFDDDGNWFGFEKNELLDEEIEGSDNEKELSENEKFEAWKSRAEAIIELREAQEDLTNQENRKWEDWLIDGTNGAATASSQDYASTSNFRETERLDPTDITPEKNLVENVRSIILGNEDDLLYEDRVFRYASRKSAIFLSFLIIVPLAVDFVVHDYVLMPFLDRYVKTVPFAAQIFDVRRPQKLKMVQELKIEKARISLEVEIGKLPPLSDEETWFELRHKALELQEDWRLENRKAFANILSDMAFGITLFVLLILNQSRVALLKFTGYKIVSNISDTGKAFIIILVTDIFLGYHSESGWQTLLEVLVEHYGLQVDQSAIITFVCIIPVILDACVKLWLFKYLPRLSTRVSNIFQEMKRH